jgi:hypothetical protein
MPSAICKKIAGVDLMIQDSTFGSAHSTSKHGLFFVSQCPEAFI